MLEPRQRTAMDGKVWWCVFNTETCKWSTDVRHTYYKRKMDCQYAIEKTAKEDAEYAEKQKNGA